MIPTSRPPFTTRGQYALLESRVEGLFQALACIRPTCQLYGCNIGDDGMCPRPLHLLKVPWYRMRIAVLLICVFQCSFVVTNASAQNPYNMMNLFGGIMQSAIMQATLAEWQKIPPAERSCIDEALHERGVSLQSLVQQGIAPFDARLSDIRASCLPQLSKAHPEPNQINEKANT